MTTPFPAQRPSSWIRLLAVSVLTALLLTGCVSFTRSATGIDPLLAQTAEEVNKNCPMMVDADTRMDNVVALPGKVLAYNYTLVNYAKSDLSDENVKAVEEAFAPQVRNKVKSSSDMKSLRDYRTTFRYVYRSNDGVEFMSIAVAPDDYR